MRNHRVMNLESLEHLFDGFVETRDGDLLPIHRVLVSSISPFFNTAFLCASEFRRIRGGDKDTQVCRVEWVETSTMKQIIRFAFDEGVSISDENVRELIEAADSLQIQALLDICCKYVRTSLSFENCIGLYSILVDKTHLGCTGYCHRFIITNFERLAQEKFPSLATLDAQKLAKILRCDDLNVSGEPKVLETIFFWMSRNAFQTYSVRDLLGCVRLKFEDLSEVQLAQDVVSKQILSKCLNSKGPSRPIMAKKLFAFFDIQEDCCVYKVTYDEQLDFWRSVATIPLRPEAITGSDAGAVCLLESSGCWMMRLADGTLSRLPDFRLHRQDYGAALVDGHLYVIGGVYVFPRYAELREVERLDVHAQQWAFVQSTAHPTRGEVAVIGHRIYACGRGRDPDGDPVVTLESYDPISDSWTDLPRVPRIDRTFSVVGDSGQLYVAGYVGSNVLVSWIDVETPDHWSGSAELIGQPLLYPKMAVLWDSVVVYESSEEDSRPHALVWKHGDRKRKWRATAGLDDLRGCRVRSIEDRTSLRSLGLCRSAHDWTRLELQPLMLRRNESLAE